MRHRFGPGRIRFGRNAGASLSIAVAIRVVCADKTDGVAPGDRRVHDIVLCVGCDGASLVLQCTDRAASRRVGSRAEPTRTVPWRPAC
jgi:hypothetical protein